MTRLLQTPYWLAAALLVIGLAWTASAGLLVTTHWSAVLGPFLGTAALLGIGFINRERWRAAPTLWRTRTSLAALGTALVSVVIAAVLFGPAVIGIGLQLGGLVGFVGLAVMARKLPGAS
ncbi:MAG: hypothetical protein CMH90_09740 [Oceanicaulis sp.]|uniref:hypothetical protein n=1 Tax=Oceanicaulis sp. UBA2681 TaxID=1947007 RepID=UPI000C0A6AF3|nr:hypothetical protein [Oceanicaulis sp. UBA2681]MAP49749.1 hypothetical protein [Oceanicaulis sp.]|tara:strand:- start:2899 stop:3258 length:360 start_codon:yes stop_codon:yes gene_type:complete